MAVNLNNEGLVLKLDNSPDNKAMGRFGGPATASPGNPRFGATIVARCDLTSTGTARATVASITNPEGRDVVIVNYGIAVTAASSVAGTFDFGAAAATALTSNDNLLDGVSSSNAVTGLRFIGSTQALGTNGARTRTWRSSQFVTLSRASGTLGSFRGTVFVEYVVP